MLDLLRADDAVAPHIADHSHAKAVGQMLGALQLVGAELYTIHDRPSSNAATDRF